MPSGYTEKLYKGEDQTFEQFVMQCARAFGALIELRDEPHAEIPEKFEASPYERPRLDAAIALVIKLRDRSDDEWAAAQDAEIEEHNEHVRKAITVAGERRVRYEHMLARVHSWRPPTEEHKGLKDFMVKQLEDSIAFDCSTRYLEEQSRRPIAEYALRKQDEAARQLDRAEQSWNEAQARAAGRTTWVKDLRKSLGEVAR
jgi:hypothetical protein